MRLPGSQNTAKDWKELLFAMQDFVIGVFSRRHGLLPDQTPATSIMNTNVQQSDDDSDLGPD